MAFLSSNSWMGVPVVLCCMYLSRPSEALICNMKPSHQHFFIIIVMLISLIKMGSVSIKKNLGTVLSKQNIFACLPLLKYQQAVLDAFERVALRICKMHAALIYEVDSAYLLLCLFQFRNLTIL